MEKIRPDIANLPTSNPSSATGDGIIVGKEAGADVIDMFYVQVHPTGFIHPDKPRSEQHELVLATEALRGHGGLLFNQLGRRFVNEAGHRDWVSEAEMKNQKFGDIYIFMNSGVAKDAWKPFTQQYAFLGLLKKFTSGKEACKHYKIPYEEFSTSIKFYNLCAERGWSPDGKDRFDNTPFNPTDEYYVGIVTPLLHYTMGGLKITEYSEVVNKKGEIIPGFFAGGECAGGVHNKNRLAGNSLVDCVVYGRTAGKSACKFLKKTVSRL
jgi:succinate dehydrogenase/fumarate reductase flavoprotein subunit